MKTDRLRVKTKKIKRSLLARIHLFMKKYAENCKYSFETMLKI